MSIPILSRNRGGSFAAGPAAPSGVTYDEDAQTYFDALEAASGWSEPADYDDKKSAISDYFTNLKEDSNFTPVKALYLPIWRVAAPNAINAVNPGTYDLTFVNTVTHNGGDYIYGDGEATNGGYAHGGFHGPASSNAKFFGVGSASAGVNILDNNGLIQGGCAFGWYNYFFLHTSWNTTYAGWHWTANQAVQYDIASNTAQSVNLFTSNSIDPGAGKTSKGVLYRDGSLINTGAAGTGTGSNAHADAIPMALMAKMHNNGAAYYEDKRHHNFWFFGTELDSISAFNTDTATMLAAI